MGVGVAVRASRVRVRVRVRASSCSTLVDFLSRGSTVLEFLITGSGSMPPYLVKFAWVAFGIGLG